MSLKEEELIRALFGIKINDKKDSLFKFINSAVKFSLKVLLIIICFICFAIRRKLFCLFGRNFINSKGNKLMQEIKDLKQFYDFMFLTRQTKQRIFDLYVNNEKEKIKDLNLIKELQVFQSKLENIPNENGKYKLRLNEDKDVLLDLSYEINELKKDIFFLLNGEDEFEKYLEAIHIDFKQSITAIVSKLKSIKFHNLITDRDGTINNYCGRYISSIQSVYNAVFLYRFAANSAKNSILLTSAPLNAIGMVDISLLPKDMFIYAGSKAREYFDHQGIRHQFSIEEEKQQMLDKFNHRLKQLLEQSEYSLFSLIGSGLQLKFGQTTIARQNISGTVPENESIDFLETINKIVQQLDPEKRFFRMEDTGKDIEIILTIDNGDDKGKIKDFDKGDGVNYLDQELSLNISDGPNLICGDTASDVAMIEASMAKSSNTWTIFVTQDLKLKNRVKDICSNSFFVQEPDMLVMILNLLGK